MDYEMKEISTKYPSMEVLKDMYKTIMLYLRGSGGFTERMRQFWTWGAYSFKYICSNDGCYGIQFMVSGMLHKGRVRVYYNPSSDYFDVELLRPRKDSLVWGCSDLDFTQLHNVLHQHIERTDDEEV